ncbi:MAG: hypothetical protein II721_04675, partial [Bacilli bacterium]|nr:hypothetical protein [Bacilli bacterium]
GKTLSFTSKEKGVFEVKAASGGEALIDTVKDTLYSEDYEEFINTTIYRQEDAKNVYYDGSPFLRFKSSTVDKAPTPKNIAFKADYGIDLFTFDNDILLPVVTASNLFEGPTMLTCLYNLDNLYFIDSNNASYDAMSLATKEDYSKGLSLFYEEGKRSKEQAEFAYGELCFYLDTYYGHPGRETLHDAFLEKGSLDAALSSHDEFTKKAREWLKSTDKTEYYAGLYLLDDYLADTGHTYVKLGTMMLVNSDLALYEGVAAKLASIGYKEGQNAAKRLNQLRPGYREAHDKARTAKGIKDKTGIIEGDTLLYTFDSFTYDDAAWRDYISHTVEEMPHDPIGELVRLLEEHKDGGNVKNVVIDVSDNAGGSGDIVFMMMALMGKEPHVDYFDSINQNQVHVEYEADLNFDGKFDALDKEVSYPYNFAILESNISFSCGNLLPFQAKESGLLVLGDQSRGGACSVLDGVLSEGTFTRIGGQIRLCDKTGESIDFGVEPNVSLYHKEGEEHDFSKFFDLSLISSKIGEFYAK